MSRTCKYCGNTLGEGDNFCQKCGAVADAVEDNKAGMAAQANENVNNTVDNMANNTNNYQQQASSSNAYDGRTSGIAIGGFVCSLIGFFVMGVVLGIIAISLGAAALNHMKTFPNEKGKGLAIASIVIGIIDIIGAIVVTALLF